MYEYDRREVGTEREKRETRESERLP